MKTPKRIAPLVEDGLVDEAIRQLMSGKEATVYVVRCGDEIRCAKVYKEANKRSFHHSVDYRLHFSSSSLKIQTVGLVA